MHPLDDQKYINQHDSDHALQVALREPDQLRGVARVMQYESDPNEPAQLVVAGMGGSALAAGIARNWLALPIPFEIVKRYELPAYVGKETLVIVSSYSGNTEETLSALAEAEVREARIAIIAAGGKLLDIAKEKAYPYVQLAADLQPRMAVLSNLGALVSLIEKLTGLAVGKGDELIDCASWLDQEVQRWLPENPADKNIAKQLAEHCTGKTPVVYAGSLMSALAYKWKIGFNENAKNVAFTNELPEFNHNEFIGWTSHPIEKPYAILDLVSSFEHSRVLKRFEVTDRLLSGMRPKAVTVQLQGDTPLKQLLWGAILGDFVSIYLALLNGVNPTPVALIEKFKSELG